MSTSFKILFSRFLTRFGDQAWDFAIPLVLISVFPGQLQNVAGYYLISKVAQFFLNPIVLRWIDRLPRAAIYKLGIGSQTFAVLTTWVLITQFLRILEVHDVNYFWLVYLALGFVGIVGSLGSTLMEISVGYDLAADLIPKENLPTFNSQLKRIDLFTEVTAPIFAGAVMLIPNYSIFNVGFTIIAAINFITFIPEYLLLTSIKELNYAKGNHDETLYINPIQEFRSGIKDFNNPKFVVPMVAYAFLWLSVLSPHGVLLAGYLKDGNRLSEFQISIFRGLGAFFGMIPTFLFPLMNKKWGLVLTSKMLLGFQALCVLIGAVFFTFNTDSSTYLFLLMILFSRIGLYGFSIGESEARQTFIPSHLRGRVNGVGVSLTSFATLILFAIGTLMPSSSDFSFLVWTSTVSVLIGFVILISWNPQKQS